MSFSMAQRCCFPVWHLVILALILTISTSNAQIVENSVPYNQGLPRDTNAAQAAAAVAATVTACSSPYFEWPADSGYCWIKRDSANALQGPGPNVFSSSNAAVSSDGGIELTVRSVNGQLTCGEIFMDRSLGLGDYIFTIATDPSTLDKTLVGSPFLYATDTNEIDVVEYSQWNVAGSDNSQFVVQPYYNTGATHRFNTVGGFHTVRLRWSGTASPDQIRFEAWSPAGVLVRNWTAQGGNNFVPGAERVHINHWIFKPDGATTLPAGFTNSTFKVACFKHCPLGAASCAPMGTRPSCGTATVPSPSPALSPSPAPSPSPSPIPCPAGAFRWPTSSNYCWMKRSSGGALQGPGPNYFTPSNVVVTADGSLRLKVTKSGSAYNCAEVYLANSLGYGDYIYVVETSPAALHQAITGATFIYSNDVNSLNVEYARWGQPGSTTNTAYTVAGSSPASLKQNLATTQNTHRIRWAAPTSLQNITFETWSSAGVLVKSWTPTAGSNFAAGLERARVNLWVYNPTVTKPSLTTKNSVLQIKCFKFCPASSGGCTQLGSRPTCP